MTMETPRIRIGNQTNADTPAFLPFEFALRHGFDAFEWFSDRGRAGWTEAAVGPPERERLRHRARQHDVLFSVHAPYTADPTTPPGAEAILRSIDCAGDLGAGVVNLHLFPDHPARVFAEALGPLLVAAAAVGVRLSLENTVRTSPEDCNAVLAALAALPEAVGRVGLCLDMGHANLFAGTRNDYLAFVDRLAASVPIIHWHAHENWGEGDRHLTLFTGPAGRDERGIRGLARRLLRRGFGGSVVLEQWPHPPDLLVRARERLARVLGSVQAELRSAPTGADLAPESGPAPDGGGQARCRG